MVSGHGVIRWAGYVWHVKNATSLNPGPNAYSMANVRVNRKGLSMSIVKRNGTWTCSEVWLFANQSLGFGTYEFQVTGRPDRFDQNVVLGLFNFPPPQVGPSGTNEIDIEIAQWGQPKNNRMNYAVYPPKLGPKYEHMKREFKLNDTASTHCFTWTQKGVHFQSYYGYGRNEQHLLAEWNFAPEDWEGRIPQTPIPANMNLWLNSGKAPSNDKPVRIVIKSFTFTPQA